MPLQPSLKREDLVIFMRRRKPTMKECTIGGHQSDGIAVDVEVFHKKGHIDEPVMIATSFITRAFVEDQHADDVQRMLEQNLAVTIEDINTLDNDQWVLTTRKALGLA